MNKVSSRWSTFLDAARNVSVVTQRYVRLTQSRILRIVFGPIISRCGSSARQLVLLHFVKYSDVFHINRRGLTLAVAALEGRPAAILETGTSAWGTDSTRLWSAYVERFGGECWSVDIRPEAGAALGYIGDRTHLIVGDSVAFIRQFAIARPEALDLAYLDSWDTNFADPLPSAAHGLAEWKALQPLLAPGTLVVIDDTPSQLSMIPREHRHVARAFQAAHGTLPGKGALVLADIRDRADIEVIYHHYNLVMRVIG